MRIKFINKMGTIMTVDESRVEEYKAMGFKPVADTPKPKKKSTKKKAPDKEEEK